MKKLFNQHQQTIIEFIKYAIIGVIATISDFLVLVFFTEYLLVHYIISIVVAYLFASIVNFLLQKVFTFKCKKGAYLKQFMIFFTIGLGGLLINMGIIYAGVTLFGLWYIYGKVIATFVAFIWNFIANKLITFKA